MRWVLSIVVEEKAWHNINYQSSSTLEMLTARTWPIFMEFIF